MSELGKAALPNLEGLAEGLRTKVSWDDLRVFLAVAETGSFSAASRLLNATPSMVSKRMADLEATLQAQLLIRNAQGVSLSESGELVRDHCLTMKRSVSAIERSIFGQDKKQEGRVTVFTTDGLAAYVVAPALGEFFETNPRIEVALDCGLWSTNPLPDQPDLVLTMEEGKRLDHVVTQIATVHYLLAASHKYVDTYGMPSSLRAVADHRFVEFVAMKRQREGWHPQTAPLREWSEFSLQHNSSAVHFQAILNGAGIGLIPTFLLHSQDQLRIVHDQPMFSIKYYLSYHMDAMRAGRVRTVSQWLKGLFDPRRHPWFRDEFIHPDQFAPMQ